MEQIRNILINYNIEILMGLIIAYFVLLILYFISQFRINHITKKYNKLVKGVNGTNLEDVIFENLDELDNMKIDIERLESYIDELQKEFKFAIQNVGFVRYNAFAEMGRELSFSIAFLDGNLNGFVLTNIYSRQFSIVYAKSIKEGKSNYSLSAEEIQAIDRAIKKESFLGTTH